MLYVNPWIFSLIVVIVVLFLAFVVFLIVRAHQRQVTVGREGLVGETAVVETALEPKGIVRVEGERWTAIIDEGRAEPEEEVIITKVENLKLRVTRKE